MLCCPLLEFYFHLCYLKLLHFTFWNLVTLASCHFISKEGCTAAREGKHHHPQALRENAAPPRQGRGASSSTQREGVGKQSHPKRKRRRQHDAKEGRKAAPPKKGGRGQAAPLNKERRRHHNQPKEGDAAAPPQRETRTQHRKNTTCEKGGETATSLLL